MFVADARSSSRTWYLASPTRTTRKRALFQAVLNSSVTATSVPMRNVRPSRVTKLALSLRVVIMRGGPPPWGYFSWAVCGSPQSSNTMASYMRGEWKGMAKRSHHRGRSRPPGRKHSQSDVDRGLPFDKRVRPVVTEPRTLAQKREPRRAAGLRRPFFAHSWLLMIAAFSRWGGM